jgi:hypothetical protein
MDLQLGDSKQVVMSRLAEKYTMVKLEGDNWLVKSKSTPSVTYGQVLFENGELTLASKDWTKGDEDSVGFVQSLYDAFDGLGKENKHFCYVQTETTKTSVAEIRSINLSCGAKELSIETRDTLSGGAKGKSTSIQEVLKK